MAVQRFLAVGIVLALAAVLLPVGRAAPNDEAAVWHVPALEKVFPDAPILRDQPPMLLAAARGEHALFQLAVRPQANPLRNVSVVCASPGPAAATAHVRLVVNVPVRAPTNAANRTGLFPDPLVEIDPVGGVPLLPPNRTSAFWVALAVPEAAVAGTFSGRMVLRWGAGGGAKLDFELKVLNFSLSQRTLTTDSVPLIMDQTDWAHDQTKRPALFSNYSYSEVLDAGYSQMLGHRVTAIAYLPSAFPALEGTIGLPNATHKASVTLHNTSLYDAAVELVLRPGSTIKRLAVPVLLGARAPSLTLTGGFTPQSEFHGQALNWDKCIMPNGTWRFSDQVELTVFDQSLTTYDPPHVVFNKTFEDTLLAVLTAISTHLSDNGWLEKVGFSMAVKDEPFYPHNFTAVALQNLLALVKRVAPGILIEQTRFPAAWPYWVQNQTALDSIIPMVDVWSIANYFTDSDVPSRVAQLLARSKIQGVPVVQVYNNELAVLDAAGARMRLFAWLLWLTNSGNWSGVPAGLGVHGSLTFYCDNCGAFSKSPWEDPSEPLRGFWPGYGFIFYPPRAGTPRSPFGAGAALSSSVRWELFREGLEDAEALFLLQRLSACSSRNGRPAAGIEGHSALAEVRTLIWQNPLDPWTHNASAAHPYTTNNSRIEQVRARVNSAIEGLLQETQCDL